ncbi:hypothetical protein GPL21_39910 [Bradyrhizobium pachyrhizi]|uniref:Uncharacterized protein n=1 Tax=Bradyrhizobium pachyrhizi TaxID=280333 RepID=A0A844T582_9BRAD|nr:hypothetical protein [Bradyrhizobium pachyrhizi]MVT71204.1 hypothetical protein [Bradyrhizobium pachyrhizi]
MTDDIQIRRIGADEVDKRLERLADILIDCVARGGQPPATTNSTTCAGVLA